MKHEDIISQVSHPARYVGGESGSVVKDSGRVKLTMALAFPEVYEIAMSHQGLKVLYEILAARPEVAAERVFCPWIDLMDLMAAQGVAPWSLETGRPLDQFDVVGFSLQYELTYTNMLHMLRLAGIPLRRRDRGPDHPLVIAGGPCMANPEPVADFLDLVVVGEAEELINELVDLLIRAKDQGADRQSIYQQAQAVEGIYAPERFEPVYQDGRLVEIRPRDPDHPKVRRRVVADLESHPAPVKPVVPLVKAVHDRMGLEIARGCTRGCRFCAAGFLYRPVREREPDSLVKAARQGLENTGHDELALLSLSSGDYSHIGELTHCLMDELEPQTTSLSLPSLRVDSLSPELATQVKRVRKSGFTVAPEAGSQRLRSVINKNLTEEDILAMAEAVYGMGWNLVKLYFMVGLPSETDEDLVAIGRLCDLVVARHPSGGRGRSRKPLVHASLGVFVPKPHTPFQWEAQCDLEEGQRRLALARDSIGHRRVRCKWNSPRASLLEGVLSRGDRRLSKALELAVEAGCRFDGWDEELDFAAWSGALDGAGLSPAEFLRARAKDEVLPWDHIDIGVDKDFLLAELARAQDGQATADCRGGQCVGCGVCDFETIEPRLAAGPAPRPAQAASPAQERSVIRFILQKTGPARFLGHLGMMNQLARAFRRAAVEVASTQGYHPHPLIKTASALPLGVESLVEILMVTVCGRPDPRQVMERVNRQMPQGLRLAEARWAFPGEPLVDPSEVTYRLDLAPGITRERIEAFEQAGELRYTRHTPKGEREMDMKEAISRIRLEDEGLVVTVRKAAGGRPKPAEVLESVFGLPSHRAWAVRALKVGAR